MENYPVSKSKAAPMSGSLMSPSLQLTFLEEFDWNTQRSPPLKVVKTKTASTSVLSSTSKKAIANLILPDESKTEEIQESKPKVCMYSKIIRYFAILQGHLREYLKFRVIL